MRYLKLGLLLFASVFGLQRAASELIIAAKEKSPTHINVNHWDQYQGQRWLVVEGHLATERAVVRDATDDINRSKGNVYAYVPIVWEKDRTELVHAVAVIGPMLGKEAQRILSTRAGPAKISGQIAPDGVYDPARLMPGERLDPQVVFVNENTKPIGGGGMWFFFVLMLGTLLFCLVSLLRDLRQWMLR